MSSDDRMNVLIVDDIPANLLVLEAILEDLNVAIVKAGSGNEALEALLVQDIALVLLDIQMPGMDGYETAELMRGNEKTRHIPIIFITAIYKEESHVFRGYEAGAVDYIFKPFEPEILKSKVEVFCEMHRQKLIIQRQVDEIHQKNALLQRQMSELKLSEERLRVYSQRLEEALTQLKQAQEELVRRERLATLGELAGGIGHELRTPLGTIGTAASFLKDIVDGADPEVAMALEILEREVDISAQIISSLMDYASAKPPRKQEIDINSVVREALARVEVPDGVRLVSKLNNLLAPIMGDPVQLGQVFANVIKNAVQAMPEGGILTVSSAAPTKEWVSVSVSDTGSGIPEEIRLKLFEPLYSTKTEGIGLGLAIVKTMVEGHAGVVEVESKEGTGSTFTVRLPANDGVIAGGPR